MLLSRDNSNLIRCDNTGEVFGEPPPPEVSSLGWYRSGEVYNLSPAVVLQCNTDQLPCLEDPMGTLTIRIDDELENDLDQLAKAQHRTKSDLAREMLRKRIAVERFRALRHKALPLAEAAGYVTDEDIFRDI